MCRRGRAWRFSSPYSYWLRISVGSALPARATRRLLLRGGGVPHPCPPSFGLGTTPPQDTQTYWSVTEVQEYRCRVPGSISSGLTPTLREDWSGKRVLETPYHTRIATSPQDITDHVSEPNMTWDTNFPRLVALSIQGLIGPQDHAP